MEDLKIGDALSLHVYKHDGKISSISEGSIFLEETEDAVIFGNNRAIITENDGRQWKTKEPAVIYFFKNNWFNVIGQMKKDGLYFYCNIATPYVIEDGAIKYIDYDLDLRVFPDYTYRVLDTNEYNYHKTKMNYGKDIDKVLYFELDNLINMVKERKGPFKKGMIEYYYSIYKNIIDKK